MNNNNTENIKNVETHKTIIKQYKISLKENSSYKYLIKS